jgi:tRNA(adenine34) deaminase
MVGVLWPSRKPAWAAGELPIGLRWQSSPEMTWYAAPTMTGGIRREERRSLFRRYCQSAPDSGFRRWAHTLVAPGDEQTR